MTDAHVQEGGHEQTVDAPLRLAPPTMEVTWYWIEGTDSEPGWWTDDEIQVRNQRESGRLVLTAVDGRIKGVEGCAHRADVMRLTGRVRALESILSGLIYDLRGLGETAASCESELADPDGNQRHA